MADPIADPIKVFLLDDHEIVRRGVADLIDVEGLRESEPGTIAELTPREREILELIGEGRSNRQIATELFLAEKTVKNYVSNLLAKLGMQRRSEAAAFVARVDERARHRFE